MICIELTCVRRNAEMEREIADLRRRLAEADRAQATFDASASDELNQSSEDVFYDPHSPPQSTRAQSISVSVDQQASRPLPPQGPDDTILPRTNNVWRLEDITLSRARVLRLFEQ